MTADIHLFATSTGRVSTWRTPSTTSTTAPTRSPMGTTHQPCLNAGIPLSLTACTPMLLFTTTTVCSHVGPSIMAMRRPVGITGVECLLLTTVAATNEYRASPVSSFSTTVWLRAAGKVLPCRTCLCES